MSSENLVSLALIPPASLVPCRHCGLNEASARRGLCWSCYQRRGVRELYPSTSRRGVRYRARPGRRRLPEPTGAVPGSPEKVEVLRLRWLARESLHHPLDAPLDLS